MVARELELTPRLARPPRAMAWVLVLASAGAVAIVGLLATALLFGNVGGWPDAPASFWPRFVFACLLTLLSLALRSLRWIFLLRRAETRIPIRDAYIGYLAGFSLLFAPLLIGESAVRALVNQRRGRVPIIGSLAVNLWERLLDLVALGCIASAATWFIDGLDAVSGLWAIACAATLFAPVRRAALRLLVASVRPIARMFEVPVARDFRRMAAATTWLTALSTSIVAWLLPGVGLWAIAAAETDSLGIVQAERLFAQSTATSGALLAPGGVLIAGREMLEGLASQGGSSSGALLAVLGIRLATVGVSTALGLLFLLIHWRTGPANSDTHFDDIADAYDVQIPMSRRHALLELKTALMQEVIEGYRTGRRGLDAGCGQGAYVARMRSRGFDVSGIDVSAGQILLAGRNVGDADAVRVGSVLEIPAADGSYDFLYTINVLHHLGSVEEQRRAFVELLRVLTPGGLLFVHEINTRNVLFRFYMGYVFPSLNCIDEGVERWLLPHRLSRYTNATVAEVRYFTFLPDFIPQPIARALRPMERALERSVLRVYSAHYMAVLLKPKGCQ